MRRDDLTPAKKRILQRLLTSYREQAEDLQKEIDALQDKRPSDPAEVWADWRELPAPEKGKILRKLEREPGTVHGIIKNLRFDREEIQTAGRILRHIKEQLEKMDKITGHRESWEKTNQTEILELLERKARQR